MVSERTATVLKALVEEYIDTAAPVASESIALRSPVKLSSASVRNKMAELEEEGYIRRLHISSGGVPSDKGYRFYVESLDEDLEPPSGLKRQIQSRFGSVEFFAVSVVGSLGYAVSPDQQQVSRVPLHTALRGVLEPFEWTIDHI